MIFTPTDIEGALLMDPERIEDERGFFAQAWCRSELEAKGLETRLAQCSIAYNARRGTIRGLHYQIAPHAEVKVVRCTMGAAFDVIVDLRSGSGSRGKWLAVELTAKNRRALYVPAGLAHGYQTLEDSTEMFYLLSESYHPESARGVRWDDPTLEISWPLPPSIMSERDASLPRLRDTAP